MEVVGKRKCCLVSSGKECLYFILIRLCGFNCLLSGQNNPRPVPRGGPGGGGVKAVPAAGGANKGQPGANKGQPGANKGQPGANMGQQGGNGRQVGVQANVPQVIRANVNVRFNVAPRK